MNQLTNDGLVTALLLLGFERVEFNPMVGPMYKCDARKIAVFPPHQALPRRNWTVTCNGLSEKCRTPSEALECVTSKLTDNELGDN